MSILSLAVQHLLACGASADAVAKFVQEVEAIRREVEAEAEGAEAETRAKRAEYMRGYRRNSYVKSRNSYTPPSPPMINNSTPSPSPDLAKAKSIKSTFEEPLFEGFWEVYPRKVGKGGARKAYRQALKRAYHAEILAGAKAYAASKPDPQFTAHASTWLNADRWLDEPDHKPSSVTRGPWKPIEPEKLPEPSSPAELAKRQEQIRRAKEALCKKP
jgi:hypothetical protein